MIRLATLLCASALAAGLTLCAILPAAAQSSPELAPSAPDKIKIVFIRLEQGMGSRIEANLFEIVQGQPEFIGALWAGEKLVHETTPGEKTFMTFGYVGDLVFGNLSGGNTYYVLVRAHGGTGGMIPVPARAEIDGSIKALNAVPVAVKKPGEYKLVRPNAAARSRFSREKSHMQKVYDRTAGKFEGKTAAQIAERTLRAEDAAAK